MEPIKIHADIMPDEMFISPGSDIVHNNNKLQDALAQTGGKDVFISLDSGGGSVTEGFAMYDTLRMSGKNIHINVESRCHSIAVSVLLAAPKQNRTANRNSRFLLHHVRGGWGESMTSDQARRLATYIDKEEAQMIKLYSERTGLPESVCRDLVKSETLWTAEEMLKMGFIGKINDYTTNLKKSKKMATRRKAKGNIMDAINAFLGGKSATPTATNYEHMGTDGEPALITQKEDESIEVGDAATIVGTDDENNGSIEIAGGLIVTVEDGAVIDVADADVITEEEAEEIFLEDRSKVKARLINYKKMAMEATALLKQVREEHATNYVPSPRSTSRTTTSTRKAAAPAMQIDREEFDAIRARNQEKKTVNFGKKSTK